MGKPYNALRMYKENLNLVDIPALTAQQVLSDYRIIVLSRKLSQWGRREVHNGRAHFGIFGDGKELVQIVLSKFIQKGDWRSGYYRDQTLMLALGLLEPEEFFAMIYGDPDESINPSTGGRNFNNHYATRNIDVNGEMKNLAAKVNTASDLSPTAGQMPRLLGLAQASKIVRNKPEMKRFLNNNISGNEIAIGTIGDASTSEGFFFETINAGGVMQLPMAVFVYDDGYGISVPKSLQTTKASISEALKGFEKEADTNGWLIFKCKGWDYAQMYQTIQKGISICREQQIPVLFHIEELTQPLGHSTSGSHERYKSKERLTWEAEFDGLLQFQKWILNGGIADVETLQAIDNEVERQVRVARDKAWKNYSNAFLIETKELHEIVLDLSMLSDKYLDLTQELTQVDEKIFPTRRSYMAMAKRLFFRLSHKNEFPAIQKRLIEWIELYEVRLQGYYNKNLFREGADSAINVAGVEPVYDLDTKEVNGSEILSENFDALFQKYPNLVTFGEDTGKLGDVNQGMRGMQQKYGEERVSDTGIREATIIGQGIGLAMRGFRPIAEIQYLDYLIYALSQLSDDLASLQYRTKGKQAAPVIVRTRGHQLQGIWHAGSPMMMLLGSLRGMHLCVPRNMTQAAGFYNTLMAANDPALVIEPLKAYNTKELIPANPGEYRIPLGVPEIIEEGTDITLVTYGWNVHHAHKAAHLLQEYDVSAEVIDVQTLMPFDVNHLILKSVKKTGKILFIDEDVPGGATAYMMQKVMEEQQAFNYLDTAPRTLPAMEHRPAYGIDGEYFSKPNVERIFETVWEILHDVDVKKFPKIYS